MLMVLIQPFVAGARDAMANDTTEVIYFISAGELGGKARHIRLYNEENKFFCSFSEFSRKGFPAIRFDREDAGNDSLLLEFYDRQPFVAIAERIAVTLDERVEFERILGEISGFENREAGVSNAPNHYIIKVGGQKKIVIDWLGEFSVGTRMEKALNLGEKCFFPYLRPQAEKVFSIWR